MEANIKLYPEKFCRTCLCESLSMRTLSDKIEGENRTILEILGFVVNINVLLENQLPSQVCSECESILHKADAFKRRCLKSEKILKQQTKISSAIKKEYTVEIGDTKLNEASKTFIELTKPETSGSLSAKDEKLKNFTNVSISKHNNKSENNTKAIIPEGVSVNAVKVEINNEFEQEDKPSVETLPIEYEELSKETKIFMCSCGIFCKSKDDFHLHLRTTNCSNFNLMKKVKQEKSIDENAIKINKVLCSVCKGEFNSIEGCKIHKCARATVDCNDGSYECLMCMRKFSIRSAYTNHMKYHERLKFTCETCKREFRHKADLDNHILAVHSRDNWLSCDICTNCFPTEASLETHKESHKVEKKHVCEVCNKTFIKLSLFNEHMRVHTGEKPFLCSVCGKGFSQNSNLAQHVRRHQGLKPFKCEDCDRRFVCKGDLGRHTRSHSGAHPFVCEDCGSGFTKSRNLVHHRRIHTGEKPYACDLCPMRFRFSSTLKNHRRTHTGEKPFQCSYCEKSFVQRQALISHIRGHTGERP